MRLLLLRSRGEMGVVKNWCCLLCSTVLVSHTADAEVYKKKYYLLLRAAALMKSFRILEHRKKRKLRYNMLRFPRKYRN